MKRHLFITFLLGYFLFSAESKGAKSNIAAAPVITTQPVNQTVCEGMATSFQITALNAETYKWQSSSDNGGNWADISENETYSGTNSSQLTISKSLLSLSTNKFRCIATATTMPDDTSNPATLTVNPTPTTPVVYPTGSICAGKNLTLFAVSSLAGTNVIINPI